MTKRARFGFGRLLLDFSCLCLLFVLAQTVESQKRSFDYHSCIESSLITCGNCSRYKEEIVTYEGYREIYEWTCTKCNNNLTVDSSHVEEKRFDWGRQKYLSFDLSKGCKNETGGSDLSPEQKKKIWIILGAVLGGIAVLVLVCWLLYYFCKKMSKSGALYRIGRQNDFPETQNGHEFQEMPLQPQPQPFYSPSQTTPQFHPQRGDNNPSPSPYPFAHNQTVQNTQNVNLQGQTGYGSQNRQNIPLGKPEHSQAFGNFGNPHNTQSGQFYR